MLSQMHRWLFDQVKEKSAKQIKTLVFQPGVLTSDVAKGYLERLKKVLFIYPHTESSETLILKVEQIGKSGYQ